MVQTRITNNNHLSVSMGQEFPRAQQGCFEAGKQPLRQDFPEQSQFAKGSQERSGRRGGMQGQKEGGTKTGCDGSSSSESWLHLITGLLWRLSCPDARSLSTLTPHLSPLVISHPGQQGVNPRHACLYRYRSSVPFRLLLTSVS